MHNPKYIGPFAVHPRYRPARVPTKPALGVSPGAGKVPPPIADTRRPKPQPGLPFAAGPGFAAAFAVDAYRSFAALADRCEPIPYVAEGRP